MKKYTQSHEWIAVEGETGTVGISDSAQKELGEIVYVEMPKVGTLVKEGEEIAVLESTKAAVDVYSPASGEVIEVNKNLESAAQTINHSPEDDGWIFKIKLHSPEELHALRDSDN